MTTTVPPSEQTAPATALATGWRRLASNAAALLASDVLNRATTFALYALVARHLDAFAFGQMSLALTFFYTFQVIAVAGLKTLLTREVARDRTRTAAFFYTGSLLVLGASSLALALLAACVWLMGYSAATATIILLLGLGLLPFALAAVCEAMFLGWERARYTLYANAPGNLIKIAIAFTLLTRGSTLTAIVLLIVVTHLLIVVMEWGFLARLVSPLGWQFHPTLLKQMVRSTGTFFGIDSILAITPSLNVILLSLLAGEQAVGLFSAANQLLVPITLIYQSVVLSVFPLLCRQVDAGGQRLKTITNALIELLLVLTLPAIVGLFFLARPALLLLYGKSDFGAASVALQIMSISLVSIALTSALGQVLFADMRERITLRIVIVDSFVGLVGGALLIWQWGLVGAATAMVLVRMVDLVQHYLPVARLLNGLPLARLAWRPLVASGGMVLYFLFAKEQGLWLAGLAASAIYGVLFLALTCWSPSGRQQLAALRPLLKR